MRKDVAVALFLVVPTYHRNERLERLLRAAGEQTRPPERVFVIDNASSVECAAVVRRVAEEVSSTSYTYLAAGDNTGSAGATSLGMAAALSHAGDDDWIMRADDDSPPRYAGLFADRLDAAEDCVRGDTLTAGVGVNGAAFDRATATLGKLPRNQGERAQLVDYLPTNHFPVFRTGAVREVGVFRWDYFFSLTEVEYGLRLRRHGYSLYRIRPSEAERKPGKSRRRKRGPTLKQQAPTWRRYYSVRNHIVLAAEYSGRTVATRVALQALAKPLLNLPVRPIVAARALGWNLRAVRDAAIGRMGRTVDPNVVDGALDLRRGSS